MLRGIWMWSAILTVPAYAAGPRFPLGLDYSRQIAPGTLTAASTIAAAVDAAGSVYAIGIGDVSKLPTTTVLGSSGNYVMKVAPGGGKIAYLTVLGFHATALAVDPSGSVYLTAQNQVAKLNADGTALAYTATIGEGVVLAALAVDAAGRAYVTGWTSTTPLRTTPGAFQETAPGNTSHPFVVRLNAAGTAFDYATYLSGSGVDIPGGIAVDGTGAAFIRGFAQSPDFPITAGAYLTAGSDGLGRGPFLARLAPDGSRLLYATYTGSSNDQLQAVAADSTGNTAIAQRTINGGGSVLRFDAQGKLVGRSRPLPPVTLAFAGEALTIDASGTAYLTGLATTANYPVKNSLAECGSVFLSAFDASGELLQSTYVGGNAGGFLAATGLATGPDSTVYLAAPSGAPTEPMVLTRLSANTAPRPVALACVGNAASFDASAISPGEIVSLFGQGLGPPEGAQPDVTVKSGFPNRLSGVQVTFDGAPAPLLYVHDGQINAIAPWRLVAGRATKICVLYNGADASCVQRPVLPAVPGVFTVDGTHAAALNQDGTINSPDNPAPAGSIVSVFATGLGPLTPTPSDGAILDDPLPANVLIATAAAVIGGIAFSVIPIPSPYAGPAPLEVAGVSQINLRVTSSPMLLMVGPDLFFANAVKSRTFSVWVAGGGR